MRDYSGHHHDRSIVPKRRKLPPRVVAFNSLLGFTATAVVKALSCLNKQQPCTLRRFLKPTPLHSLTHGGMYSRGFMSGGTVMQGTEVGTEKRTVTAESPTIARGWNKSTKPNHQIQRVETAKVAYPVCRIVASADGKLPNPYEDDEFSQSGVAVTRKWPRGDNLSLLDKLDAIFHAKAHEDTRHFRYMHRSSSTLDDTATPTTTADINGMQEIATTKIPQEEEERQLVATLRRSLEDAGFELLSKRDYDLCEALNAGYLLRLSILPDILQSDPGFCQELYPERFHPNGTIINRGETGNSADGAELLFEGRILVFWRGYTREVTRGRLLLPKLDYLQANLVQRSAAYVAKSVGRLERFFWKNLEQAWILVQRSARQWLNETIALIPVGGRVAKVVMANWNNGTTFAIGTTVPSKFFEEEEEGDDLENDKSRRFFRLGRYGGRKIRFVNSPNPKDALNPFLICEVASATNPPCPNAHNHYLYQIEKSRRNGLDLAKKQQLQQQADFRNLNRNDFTCLYDAKCKNPPGATQLLERVTIGDVVDSFSKVGRAGLLTSLFSKSELVEPSFDEVVVVWRPLPESYTPKKQRVVLPKVVYDIADIFDIEGLTPPLREPFEAARRCPLEIRAFHRVPMANLLAVMPKTKLVLRPADAFVFDLVSVVSFLLILGSQRFDSPKLEFLALVSVVLWLIRTFFRYRNKLISYDLLVKTFLTSKISHRNAGALKYVANEAGSQRALRAALVYSWLTRRMASLRSTFVGNKTMNLKVLRAQLEREGESGVNELIRSNDNRLVRVDMNSALNDLEELNMANFSEGKTILTNVVDPVDAVAVLRDTWTNLF